MDGQYWQFSGAVGVCQEATSCVPMTASLLGNGHKPDPRLYLCDEWEDRKSNQELSLEKFPALRNFQYFSMYHAKVLSSPQHCDFGNIVCRKKPKWKKLPFCCSFTPDSSCSCWFQTSRSKEQIKVKSVSCRCATQTAESCFQPCKQSTVAQSCLLVNCNSHRPSKLLLPENLVRTCLSNVIVQPAR